MTVAPQISVDPALVRGVQENFIAYFRHFAGLPDIFFVEEETVTWIASKGLPGSLVLSTHVTEYDANRTITDTLSRIGQYANEVDWFVFPGCRPIDLGSRLAACGESGDLNGEWTLYGKIGGQPGTWMLIDLTRLPASTPVPDGFCVRQVTDQSMLDAWSEINARGFGCVDYSAFRAAYSRHGFQAGAEAVHFIGYLGNEMVTSSTLLVAGGSASVYNVSTPIELRRQGYGSAITHAALQGARARGYSSAWIWSSPMGTNVYTGIGFVIVDLGIREYQWRKQS